MSIIINIVTNTNVSCLHRKQNSCYKLFYLLCLFVGYPNGEGHFFVEAEPNVKLWSNTLNEVIRLLQRSLIYIIHLNILVNNNKIALILAIRISRGIKDLYMIMDNLIKETILSVRWYLILPDLYRGRNKQGSEDP